MCNRLVVFLKVILFTKTTMNRVGDLWDDVSKLFEMLGKIQDTEMKREKQGSELTAGERQSHHRQGGVENSYTKTREKLATARFLLAVDKVAPTGF